MDNTEKHLAQSIKKGDKKAFEKLFKMHYNELCHFACSFVKEPAEAEELVQEAFYRFWNKREKIQIRKNLKSYLYTAVRNLCTEHGRHLKVKRQYASVQHETTYSDDPHKLLEASQAMQIFEQTLNLLPERCRTIFKLSRDDGLKYREIAEKLTISVKTVEADMGITLQALRKALKTPEK